MTPREKAAAVVVAGMPAAPGFQGVLVRPWNATASRPAGSIVFADQEGGRVKTFAGSAPWRAASSYTSSADAFAAGRETAAGLHRAGAHATFAAGARPCRRTARLAPVRAARIRRRVRAGAGPGSVCEALSRAGSTARSTDEARVYGIVRARDLAPFRAAVGVGVPCVMVGHAIYPRFGSRRASLGPPLAPGRLGFRGVAITDSLGVLGSPYAPYWARLALRAGADLVLTTSARDASRMVDALVPLARRGELDAKLVRVLRYRRSLGLTGRS